MLYGNKVVSSIKESITLVDRLNSGLADEIAPKNITKGEQLEQWKSETILRAKKTIFNGISKGLEEKIKIPEEVLPYLLYCIAEYIHIDNEESLDSILGLNKKYSVDDDKKRLWYGILVNSFIEGFKNGLSQKQKSGRQRVPEIIFTDDLFAPDNISKSKSYGYKLAYDNTFTIVNQTRLIEFILCLPTDSELSDSGAGRLVKKYNLSAHI